MAKEDFLKICMSDPALVSGPMPLDLFNKSYCIVCSQVACLRSRANNMAFTNRMVNWKKDLFDNPPRADENDPQYANIRGKKFLEISRDTPGTMSARYEVQPPADVSTESQLPQTPVYSPSFPQTDVQEAPPPPPKAPGAADLTLEPPPVAPNPPPNPQNPAFNLNNTPFKQGTVIASKPEEEAVLLEPGSTFTFGSDDQASKK